MNEKEKLMNGKRNLKKTYFFLKLFFHTCDAYNMNTTDTESAKGNVFVLNFPNPDNFENS